MKSLDNLPQVLDQMISSQKEKRSKTYVAKYKGQNLIVRSGKSSWKKVNHAKAAIVRHFYVEEKEFIYDGWLMGESSYKEAKQRKEEFRNKIWELIEIVELKD